MKNEDLRFMKNPDGKAKAVDIADFVDITSGRMKSPDGIKGMKFTEAAVWAADWWQRTARFSMPDYVPRRGDEYLNNYGMKSGILLGLPWENLEKNERLQVIKTWWDQVGVKTHGLGMKAGDA